MRDVADPVQSLIRQVQIRLFVRAWMTWTLRALTLSAVAAMIWVVLTRLFAQFGDPFWVVVGLLAASYPAGLAMAILRRPTRLDAAIAADRSLGLRERVTSSLELTGISSPMADAVREDTRRQVAGLSASRAAPLTIGSRARWVSAPLLALGLAYLFLPEMDLFDYRERTAQADARREAVAVHVERIREAMQPLEENLEAGATTPMDEITAELNKLANEMSSGELTEKQAIAKLDDLAQKVDEQRRKLAEQGMLPQLAGDTKEFGRAHDLAKAIQEGKLADAQKQIEEIEEKLKDGSLSDAERKALSEGLKKLSEAMASNPSSMNQSLAESLAKASAALASGDMKAAGEALEVASLSVKDVESMMQQLERMREARKYLAEWKGDLMGPSEYCRYCGSKLGKNGECENGECEGHGHGHGLGLRGAGRGEGNRLGHIPEIEAGFQPTQAPGPLTQGKMLADLLQRGTPEAGEEATVSHLSGQFEQLEQEAEQALTQEEIPPGAKEFVRQYFGAIEPEQTRP